MQAMKWYAITLSPADPALSSDALDGICAELMERGALGTTVERAPEITCYIQGDAQAIEGFVARLGDLPCSIQATKEVSESNWTGSCPDVWEPIHAGALVVVPVESSEDTRSVPVGALRIIPGLGFGTGHHATTRMVLSELSAFAANTPNRSPSVFDLGTGSGILAIAAARLFQVPVEAIDIEEGAIINAKDNIALNHVEHLVSASTTPMQDIKGSFSLILANLYGEVLVQLAGHVTRVAASGATAIVSGITELVWDQVYEAYCEKHGWRLVRETTDSGWVCAVFER
jgi:ribosomal protein L11 methyltransferase